MLHEVICNFTLGLSPSRATLAEALPLVDHSGLVEWERPDKGQPLVLQVGSLAWV